MSRSEELLSPKIKVLHLIDSGGLYGAEKVLLTLCSEQLKQGLEPTILSCGVPGEEPKALELEAERLRIPCKAWRMKAGLNIKGMREVWEYIHSQGFTHLHSHGYKFNILLAFTKHLNSGQIFVTTLHGYVRAPRFTKMWLFEKLDRFVLWRFDNVVLVNEKMNDIPAIRRLSNRTTVIVNGLPVESNSLDLPPFELELRQKFDLLFLAVGRLSPEKGFELLLEALGTLFESDLSIKKRAGLIIYGEGRLRESLLDIIQSSSLCDNVFLAGYSQNVASYMPHFDLLVMPSLTEGLPVTLLEAVRAKISIVATRVGGIPDVIGGNSVGLIESGNTAQLGGAIKKFINDRDVFESNAECSAIRFSQEYSSVAMARKYFEVYKAEN